MQRPIWRAELDSIGSVANQFQIPRRLRAVVRARESSVIALAALIGVLGGLVVAVMGAGDDLLHELLFRLRPHEHLSARLALEPVLALSVPVVGGLAYGIATELLERWRPTGNRSDRGECAARRPHVAAWQHDCCRASVGWEAGYTQFASGIAARIGSAFRLRRADRRILVGCGAAAGIAGAFGAPLAGAFYGLLVIGSYAPPSLVPVGLSALIGFLVARSFAPADLGIVAPEKAAFATPDIFVAALIGLLSAALGIVLMRGVAASGELFARLRLRPALRPMVGGLTVGIMALMSPQVMSTGEGALRIIGTLDLPLHLT